VPTRDEQRGEGRGRPRMLQRRRKEMPFHVMHANDGLAGRVGEGLGVAHANEQRADEPRGVRDRNGIDVIERHPCIRERLLRHGDNRGEMLARGNLGHHATEEAVHILRENHQRVERRRARRTTHDGGRGFVAGALDAEDAHV
jgi:hypothetical protein